MLLSQRLTNPALDPAVGNFTGSGTTVLQTYLANGMTVALSLAGVILLAMLLIGAYQYITAGGDKEAIQKATRRMTQAVVGVIILLSIYLIAQIVGVLFGVNVLQVNIPQLL